ncbi:50S rRNA methyltransferase [Actibacterium mucosum KCTC 23349]|uniref:Ribosomal RNA large subunit methyltransferase H n=1 Tax=Actibacterium mucosum KCTC 23349 TaxID=1454373 RepID=A0A037ZMY4_9RHOB|nr:23S rRNA (pseudouridine(1915)-N(3))-methyltransferase RlmH [Actibacterium mucosum]KAJ57424.1 50S rRNA methyltransferase [Actibacterium mucosum KCTC 23349]
MRVKICAVGRMRSGPEKLLFDDYADRFSKTGRALSLGPLTVTEVEDKKNRGQQAEADLLRNAIPKGALICAMDERGKTRTSPQFAQDLARWRDNGTADLALVIGGADGLTPGFRAEANTALSFGTMVWPHMLARVMLAEQLYRAASILAGAPYHRE